jgi:(2Fe-2S) ferredoxin
MPEGLEIDHEKNLNGTMAAYAEQVLICTGKDDWMSRIEEENAGDNLAADIKELLGRGGVYRDVCISPWCLRIVLMIGKPYHNVSVINSSFQSSVPERREIQTTSAYILPSFKYVPFLPRVSFDSVQALVKGYLLPKKLHPAHDNLSPIHRDRLLRSESQGSFLYGVQDVEDVLVLICGHGGRDGRCGVMGPVLREEFERQLPGQGYQVLKGPVESFPNKDELLLEDGKREQAGKGIARVGLISHIGGHKFAGNVILYFPPGLKGKDGNRHALAGCGIWYGRVEPRHVDGILKETLGNGKVVEELFRGGIRQGGEILRL